jgi:hypothetical protein
MRASFNIYEIEHQGDEGEVVRELRALGATDITVVSCDYDGEESIRVECTLPDGMTWPQFREQLERTELCL